MKTLDIALEYLNELDFTQIDIRRLSDPNILALPPEDKSVKDRIMKIAKKYLTDGRLTFSNENYHSLVFENALIIKQEEADGFNQFFESACMIIMQNSRGPLNCFLNLRKEMGYPKRILKKFNTYCTTRSRSPYYIRNSEMRMDLFAVAWHYLIDEK